MHSMQSEPEVDTEMLKAITTKVEEEKNTSVFNRSVKAIAIVYVFG